MAEFIVDYPDDLIAEGYAEECINIHERIVRCRDCKHFKLRVVEDDSTAGINLFGSCERLRACGREFGMYQNDFCSRGERRE